VLRAAARLSALGVGLLLVGLGVAVVAGAADPPAINPFAKNPAATGQRDDAVPGYLELSDGTIRCGRLYLTRDKRLQVRDTSAAEGERQREIPLQVVRQIDCKVKKEWMEKEWRFKELTQDQKLYTGKSYPTREYEHTITLRDGRQIKGDLSGIIYVVSGDDQAGEPERFLFHKRQKGELGQTLKQLPYVKTVKLGDEAFNEGKRKASVKKRVGSRR
jgi:hypothetical protein